ncbi:tetratricopeptide repeat protein [Streptomyces sp. NPDC057474]|uniref:tetratricopeptide repeat protein n=1 Tax=Streptomyces sp. NPDC057474 TaxID=3346144 RepID=UPI0036C7C7B7
MTAATTSVRCPVVLCRRENAYGAEVCAGCRTPLSGYARLHVHPAHLFNRGLAAAREGSLAAARDCFAAVVHWCPGDTEARNALALAGLGLGDHDEARRQWTEVLARRPGDPKATRGLARLAAPGGTGDPGGTGGPDEVDEVDEVSEPGAGSG